MDNEIKIRFGIDTIEDEKFKLSDSIPQELSASGLNLRFLVETEILRSEEKVKVSAGVIYSYGEETICELVIGTVFMLAPFSEIVTIDEAKKTVSFQPNVIQTLLGAAVGILRGVLYEKTKGTPLAAFPIPLIPMPALVEMNRFRVEKNGVGE